MEDDTPLTALTAVTAFPEHIINETVYGQESFRTQCVYGQESGWPYTLCTGKHFLKKLHLGRVFGKVLAHLKYLNEIIDDQVLNGMTLSQKKHKQQIFNRLHEEINGDYIESGEETNCKENMKKQSANDVVES